MALWQFTFRIVPKKVLLKSQGFLPSQVSNEQFLDLPTWSIKEYEIPLVQLLNSCFSKEEARDNYRRSWGNTEETILYFSYDERDLVDFTIRLDLRSLKKEIIILICKIGHLLDAVLVTENGSVIEPNEKQLIEEIKLSKAFKFVGDPRGFFNTNSGSE